MYAYVLSIARDTLQLSDFVRCCAGVCQNVGPVAYGCVCVCERVSRVLFPVHCAWGGGSCRSGYPPLASTFRTYTAVSYVLVPLSRDVCFVF